MSNNIIKMRIKCFEGYGLDKDKNFLKAPVCECGCGEKAQAVLANEEELFGFMYNLLLLEECGICAVFAHGYDDKMYAAIKADHEDGKPVKVLCSAQTNMNFFKDLNEAYEFHRYGLMVQRHDDKWDIIEG